MRGGLCYYGRVVDENAFGGREKKTAALVKAIGNVERFLGYSERT